LTVGPPVPAGAAVGPPLACQPAHSRDT
jgi:hypothetical protein